MTIYQDLRAALVGDGPTMAIAQQIYQGTPSDEAARPFGVFHEIDDTSPQTVHGGDDTDTVLGNIQIQLDAWADDVDTAQALSKAMRTAMRASANFQFIRRNRRTLFDKDTGAHGVSVDLSVWYQET